MTPYGFRILGSCAGERRVVDWSDAFAGYASLDARAEVHREAYLSAFAYGEDFRSQLESTSSTKGFDGACWSPWIWADIDRQGALDRARLDAARLASFLADRFRLDDDDLLIFFSGSKGFHIGLPTTLWEPEPAPTFNRTARRFAEGLAAVAPVTIDTGVYDKVRPFRAPNSRHPKTGRHKVRLSLDELTGLSVAAILDRATTPERFDIPTPTGGCKQAAADWHEAAQLVKQEAAAAAQRRAANDGKATLNRATLDFIRDGAAVHSRAVRLFSAAANLAEFHCSAVLAHALLTESALNSGLTPKEITRQIECGLKHISTRLRTPGKLFPDGDGGYYDARM